MGRKCDLTLSEKCVITSEPAKSKLIFEISQIIRKFHQTLKRNSLNLLLQYVRGPTRARRELFLFVCSLKLSLKLLIAHILQENYSNVSANQVF